ncbi:MAG TPA: hypothetical protein VEU62_17290 [Bryobacterales bacterium]|nr:hypothetical protein [Bryobacterales bacterium]
MRNAASLLALFALLPAWAWPLAAQRLRVTETAGIRRFSYPVTATLTAPGQFRVLQDGHAVPAQFRGREFDFNVSLGPYESREYTLEPEASPVLDRPVITEQAGDFDVSFTSSLRFSVSRTLAGFLASVQAPRWDYLRPGSAGLILRARDGSTHRLAASSARILKDGPLAAALEFTASGPAGAASTIRLDFPRSKSWVRVTWSVSDPSAQIAALGLDLNLNLSNPPALVDFGAGSLVYTPLKPGQSAALVAGPQSWRVLVAGEPYVSAKQGRAEGWAHVMDRDRATAVAIAGFGSQNGRIEVASDGRLQIWREGTIPLTFWLHFVTMPIQIGAATSPQSILAPLQVEWLPAH